MIKSPANTHSAIVLCVFQKSMVGFAKTRK
jgi:hypothetical protein